MQNTEESKASVMTMIIITFSDSDQDGVGQCRSRSGTTGFMCFLNRIKTQSMILMIRCGGLASFLTVAISDALIVYGKKTNENNKLHNSDNI